MSTFRITPNTDSIDIDQHSIGLDVERSSWPQDVREHLKTNRGLHLQIRHNRDKQAFAQADELARLISAAPEMLDALLAVQKYLDRSGEASLLDSFGVNDAIAKARGES